MRAVLGWVLSCWSVVASAASPASVSTGLSDALADSIAVAGLALVVAVAIMAFRYMRRALGDSGSARMSWAEKGEVYSSLRADGWTHQEIERGWKGLAP
jgi:hypothetical protein